MKNRVIMKKQSKPTALNSRKRAPRSSPDDHYDLRLYVAGQTP